ncbi:MAG: hypothetical protein IT458_09265 [Planctomycetes bacterium]|nr:hypothetical protein [Planctomycetota bacterium]
MNPLAPLLVLALSVPLCPQEAQATRPAGGEPAKAFAPMPVPRSLVGQRGATRITVDGGLADWPSAPPLTMDDARQLSGTAFGAWRGPADLAAKAFLLWDEEDLYLGCVVRDDWHRPLDEAAAKLLATSMLEIPPADSVVLSFDPDRNTRAAGNDPGRVEDREFWLAEIQGGKGQVVLWDRYRGSARLVGAGSLAVGRDQERGLTTYEVRLPWKEILPPARAPRRGDTLGVRIVVNDYDEPTDPLPQTRAGWTFGCGPTVDPALYGVVLLHGTLDPPPERMPEFPPPPPAQGDPVPSQAYWVAQRQRLAQTRPVRVSGSSGDARSVLGGERLAWLENFEHHLATFPRLDFVELQARVHRRMNREVAGYNATGLPWAWQDTLADLVRREKATPPPEQGLRLARLPQGGWLVRSRGASFLIDPAGAGIEHELPGLADFVVLTQPQDPTRRNDYLLIRMVAARKPVFAHIGIHLPAVPVAELPVARPGEATLVRGVRVLPVGARDAAGRVPPSFGYLFTLADGSTLLASGEDLQEEDLPRDLRVGTLLLSARHVAPRVLGQRLQPGLTVLTDVLQCAALPGAEGRVPLAAALQLQDGLRPYPSVLLAPGESLTLPWQD